MRWTNASVHRFASHGQDPIEKMEADARELALFAIDLGWSGPPFDPLKLAELLGFDVEPRDDVSEARVLYQDSGKYKIEFNPNRPPGRLSFSIAHEIAHTLFPDCKQRVRHRGVKSHDEPDDWQVEMLCNVGAAELLIPIASVLPLQDKRVSIDELLTLRRSCYVSTEAVLIRLAKISSDSCAAFCASRVQRGINAGTYRLDYVVPSRTWNHTLKSGTLMGAASPVAQCVAIGYTAKGTYTHASHPFDIECVGLPPYPGQITPRVAGLAWVRGAGDQAGCRITYLRGNALTPLGVGPRIISHIVNNRTTNWGGASFAAAVKRKWPEAHRKFVDLVESSNKSLLMLGATSEVPLEKNLTLVNIVAQRGYGPSEHPRLRYAALKKGLDQLAVTAKRSGAAVHMPRMGTGNAGGNWEVIEELIDDSLIRCGIPVTVYDLPE